MSDLNRTTNLANISRLTDRLYREQNSGKKDTLHNFLIEEEYRYGFYVEKLEIAAKLNRESAALIQKQRITLQELQDAGEDAAIEQRLLQNLLLAHDLFERFERLISRELDRNKLV